VALPLQKHVVPVAPADGRGEAAQPSGAPDANKDDVSRPAAATHWLRKILEEKDDSSAQAPAPWRHTDPIVKPLVADFTVGAWCIGKVASVEAPG